MSNSAWRIPPPPTPFFLCTLAKQVGAEPLGFSFPYWRTLSWSRCFSGLFWTRPYSSFPESEFPHISELLWLPGNPSAEDHWLSSPAPSPKQPSTARRTMKPLGSWVPATSRTPLCAHILVPSPGLELSPLDSLEPPYLPPLEVLPSSCALPQLW